MIAHEQLLNVRTNIISENTLCSTKYSLNLLTHYSFCSFVWFLVIYVFVLFLSFHLSLFLFILVLQMHQFRLSAWQNRASTAFTVAKWTQWDGIIIKIWRDVCFIRKQVANQVWMILNRAKHVSLCVCRAEADATPHRRQRNVVCRLRCGWRCEKDEVNVGVVFCCCFWFEAVQYAFWRTPSNISYPDLRECVYYRKLRSTKRDVRTLLLISGAPAKSGKLICMMSGLKAAADKRSARINDVQRSVYVCASELHHKCA